MDKIGNGKQTRSRTVEEEEAELRKVDKALAEARLRILATRHVKRDPRLMFVKLKR